MRSITKTKRTMKTNQTDKTKETVVVKDGKRYKEIPLKSAVPIWIAAAVWVVTALFFPMYRWYHYLIVAVVSVIAGGEAASLLPKEKKLIQIPWTATDGELNSAAEALTDYAAKYRAAAARIRVKRPETAAKVVSIADTTEKIRDAVLDQPEELKRLKRFLSYYLPTVQKLTERYAFLTEQDATGANISEAETAIEAAVEQTEVSFRRQLDALYSDDALDLSTDGQVLETLLAKDALL